MLKPIELKIGNYIISPDTKHLVTCEKIIDINGVGVVTEHYSFKTFDKYIKTYNVFYLNKFDLATEQDIEKFMEYRMIFENADETRKLKMWIRDAKEEPELLIAITLVNFIN
jgi:hypothetical protein